jgi:hypothetical protein
MNLLRRQSSTYAREMRVKESAKAWVSSELEAKATKTLVRVIRSALEHRCFLAPTALVPVLI